MTSKTSVSEGPRNPNHDIQIKKTPEPNHIIRHHRTNTTLIGLTINPLEPETS
ncbi:MAG: hypothetical protein NWE89_04785 [Candidatus Bathyarchaeota archaeon]|nr:hypothetical protein [Candidatus Bathyarchaeota archaeon]